MSYTENVFDDETNTLYEIVYNDDGTEKEKNVITENFFPEKIFFDIDDGEVSVRLWTSFRNRDVVKTITLDKLQANSLVELTRFGFPFSDSRIRKLISQWLILMIQELPIQETTKGLGWKKEGEKSSFSLNTPFLQTTALMFLIAAIFW